MLLKQKKQITLEDLKSQIQKANEEFPPIDFLARLRKDSAVGVAVVAEIKRASPSKGDIAPDIVAGEQGLKYAKAGAAGISVLTEPTWFKGTLSDMRDVRKEVSVIQDRPAILRKDFLIDEYQIYEARVYGADTVLLIVAVLSEPELLALITCARALHMEPLVEVNNDEEAGKALRCGARVVGVNNRSLHTFSVDPGTTDSLVANNRAALVEGNVLVAALSGIQCRTDVQRYQVMGVEMVLVGEALMRSEDPSRLISNFRGLDDTVLVKTCGFKDPAIAIHAARAGADFIGLVFAAGSPRTVTVAEARAIIRAIRVDRCILTPDSAVEPSDAKRPAPSLRFAAEHVKLPRAEMEAALRRATAVGPLFVGVFANQDRAEVKRISEEVGLDIIQLSGHEGWADLDFYAPYAVINAEHVGDKTTVEELEGKVGPESSAVLMLDTKHPTMEGGTGQAFDWTIARQVQERRPLFVAGGLDPGNVAACVQQVRPFAVDASSGMEVTKGAKDPRLVHDFVRNAKAALHEKGLISDMPLAAPAK